MYDKGKRPALHWLDNCKIYSMYNVISQNNMAIAVTSIETIIIPLSSACERPSNKLKPCL